jgi:phosphopantetheinyl transferase
MDENGLLDSSIGDLLLDDVPTESQEEKGNDAAPDEIGDDRTEVADHQALAKADSVKMISENATDEVNEIKVGEEPTENEQLEQGDASNETAVEVQPSGDAGDSTKDGAEYDEEEDETLYERVAVDYASKSAGALIIEKSQDFQGTSNLLNGDRDKYAIAPCSAPKKSVVLSLSEDILVKVIKLAHYERFSSTVKDFQVLGSQTLGKWMDLGTYHAERGLGEQTFTLTNPAWARYLKFKLKSHHGNEHYCTLSQIKVHGSTMVQGFHEQWEMIDDISDIEEDTAETSGEESMRSGESSDSRVDASTAHDEIGYENHGAPILDTFQSSARLFQMLGGEIQDDAAVSEFYDHIPSALGALPAHSKHSLERSKVGNDSVSSLRITQLTMHPCSISKGLQSCDSTVLGFCNDTGFITVPKMNDLTTESVQERFGSNIPLKLTLNLSRPLDPLTAESFLNEATSAHGDVDGAVATGHSEIEALVNEGRDALVQNESDNLPMVNSERKGEPVDITVDKEDIVMDTETKQAVDEKVSKLLEDLPSAECLANLNFTDFKAKISAARKSTSGGASQGGGMLEPIFKKLMDEIFALQTSLSVHDQFTKASIECYQRILLDMAVKMEKVKGNHEERLQMLEKKMLEPATLRFLAAVFHYAILVLLWLRRNLPEWLVVAKNDLAIPFFNWVGEGSYTIVCGLISYWRERKASFVPFNNSSQFNKTLISLIHFVDGMVDKLSTTSDRWVREDLSIEAASTNPYSFFSAWKQYSEEGLWAYPLVPLFSLLLVCRIIMCFTPNSSKFSRTRVAHSPRLKSTSPKQDTSLPLVAHMKDNRRSKTKVPQNRLNGNTSAPVLIEEEEDEALATVTHYDSHHFKNSIATRYPPACASPRIIRVTLLNIRQDVKRDDKDATLLLALLQDQPVLRNARHCSEDRSCEHGHIETKDQVQRQITKFLQTKDKYTALASMLLKSIAYHEIHDDAQNAFTVVDLPRTPHNQPYIPPTIQATGPTASSAILFPLSISHQFPIVGMARLSEDSTFMSEEASTQSLTVGLDIVMFDTLNTKLYTTEDEFLEVFQDSFVDSEWQSIHNATNKLQEFYVQWAIKEAYTKARGLGMGIAFHSFCVNMEEAVQEINDSVTCLALWESILAKTTARDGQIPQSYCSFNATIHHFCTQDKSTNDKNNELYTFFFLPLLDGNNKDSVSNIPMGCACICLGPFDNRQQQLRWSCHEPTDSATLDVQWTSIESLIDWHQAPNKRSERNMTNDEHRTGMASQSVIFVEE